MTKIETIDGAQRVFLEDFLNKGVKFYLFACIGILAGTAVTLVLLKMMYPEFGDLRDEGMVTKLVMMCTAIGVLISFVLGGAAALYLTRVRLVSILDADQA